MLPLILASKSPRREVLLRLLTDDFTIDARPVEEVAPHALDPAEAVELIARKKALAASVHHPGTFVLAADTVVVVHGHLMGKARDEAMARLHLAELAAGTHQVCTGIALAWGGGVVDGGRAVTAVHMDRLPKEVLEAYIASGEWIGKAGGYGIQDALLKGYVRIQAGPWSNVVGLPMALTAAILKRNRVPCGDAPAESWLEDHNPFVASVP